MSKPMSMGAIVAILGLCLGILAPGCVEEEEEPKLEFDPPLETSVVQLEVTTPGGQVVSATGQITGTREVNGDTYQVFTIPAASGGGAPNVDIWIRRNGDKYTVAGGQVAAAGVSTTVELDEPISINTGVQVGETRTVQVGAAVQIGGSMERVDTEIEYTKEDDNATVATPMGEIPGTDRFVGAATYQGSPVTGEAYHHDQLGVVAARISSPVFGEYEFGMGELGAFNDQGNRVTVMKTGLLTAGGGVFHVSSEHAFGRMDANKDEHALMGLEYRWASDAKARTTEQPPVDFQFQTEFGWFPSFAMSQPTSLLHPGETVEGYTYWVATVNQGAKNQSSNPIIYQVTAGYSGSSNLGDIRISGVVNYPLYEPAALKGE